MSNQLRRNPPKFSIQASTVPLSNNNCTSGFLPLPHGAKLRRPKDYQLLRTISSKDYQLSLERSTTITGQGNPGTWLKALFPQCEHWQNEIWLSTRHFTTDHARHFPTVGLSGKMPPSETESTACHASPQKQKARASQEGKVLSGYSPSQPT